MRRAAFATGVLLAGALTLPLAAQAGGTRPDTGWTTLWGELGERLPIGRNVQVMQVEPLDEEGALPFLGEGDDEFSGKLCIDRSAIGLISPHAVSVGSRWYGNTSGFAPGISVVEGYEAYSFLERVLQWQRSELDPEAIDPGQVRIINHSWVYDVDEPQTIRAMRRVDYQVDQFDVIHVSACNNGAGTILPMLMAGCYNGIAVGLADGSSSRGPTTLDEPGRVKPEIVVPETACSYAAPEVAGAVAMLLEQGAPMTRLSQKPFLIKAILLAGAEKLEGWQKGDADPDDDEVHPLDWRYGAGLLRVDRNYQIMDGGEFSPDRPEIPAIGWSVDEVLAEDVRDYRIAPRSGETVLSAGLAWNRHHSGDFETDEMRPLSQLILQLWLADADHQPAQLLQESRSPADNIQHIYATRLPRGVYYLRVISRSRFAEEYGLAWWTNGNIIFGDMNGDNVVNHWDIDPFLTALLDRESYALHYPGLDPTARGDINGDGAFNFFDVEAFIALLDGE